MANVLLCQGTALALPFKDASVHVCCTSPPYWQLRSYGIGEGALGLEALHDCLAWARQEPPCGTCWVCQMRAVFGEIWRVLRDDGVMFINVGDSYNSARGGVVGNLPAATPIYQRGEPVFRGAAGGLKPKDLCGLPWRLALALQADGWVLRSEIIWHKLNPMPESVQDRPTRAHEQVFLFSKQARYFYDAEAVREPHGEPWRSQSQATYQESHGPKDRVGLAQMFAMTSHREYNPAGRNARTVWRIASEPFSGSHFATFPQALVRRCLLASAPSQVCARCGAPWKREVERGALVPDAPEHRPRGALRPDGLVKRAMHPAGTTQGHPNHHYEYTTTGFSPTCACAAGVGKAVILDPFCGSGTTLFVARELGHHAVGLDLSAEYLRNIARVRLGLTALQEWQEGAAPRHDRYDDLPLFGGEGAPHVRPA